MPSVGPWELAIIAVIVVIIFGAGKLPQVGGALGTSIRDFKRSLQGDDEPEQTSQSQ